MGSDELEQLFFPFSPTHAKRQHLGAEYMYLTGQMLISFAGSNLPIYIGRINLMKSCMQSEFTKINFNQNKLVKASCHLSQ